MEISAHSISTGFIGDTAQSIKKTDTKHHDLSVYGRNFHTINPEFRHLCSENDESPNNRQCSQNSNRTCAPVQQDCYVSSGLAVDYADRVFCTNLLRKMQHQQATLSPSEIVHCRSLLRFMLNNDSSLSPADITCGWHLLSELHKEECTLSQIETELCMRLLGKLSLKTNHPLDTAVTPAYVREVPAYNSSAEHISPPGIHRQALSATTGLREPSLDTAEPSSSCFNTSPEAQPTTPDEAQGAHPSLPGIQEALSEMMNHLVAQMGLFSGFATAFQGHDPYWSGFTPKRYDVPDHPTLADFKAAFSSRSSHGIKAIEAMLEKGLNLGEQDNFLNTPLHFALNQVLNKINNLCEKGAFGHGYMGFFGSAILPLIEKSDESILNLQDNIGDTPLHRLAQSDYDRFFEGHGIYTRFGIEMIERGADLSIKNQRGETPFDIAVRKKNSDFLKAVISSGAKLPLDKNNTRDFFLIIEK
ncbi:ankyrin repeat domain-containing protein [Endozoicomonas atrinae]|uniref:ankyrin repeat domain-containing protein n=1 Tax=Endozoicomonas atrinae TaxID=1333660 RepID=UPI003B005462